MPCTRLYFIGYASRIGKPVSYTHLGMVLITEASQRQGLTEKGTVERICAVLERHGLPIADTATLDDYLPGVALDKKRSGTDIDLALLRRIGEGFLYRMPVALLGGFLRGEEL